MPIKVGKTSFTFFIVKPYTLIFVNDCHTMNSLILKLPILTDSNHCCHYSVG